MDAGKLIEWHDRVADAPDAIPRLRRFVLDLAVRGKLVEQDGAEEPASFALQRHVAARLSTSLTPNVRAGNGASAGEPSGQARLPAGWAWSTLGEVGEWGSGSTPSRARADYYGGGYAWLKSGELGDSTALSGSEETITEKALRECTFRRNQRGDVLIAMYGATIGKLAILSEPAVTNQAVCGCAPLPFLLNRFLFLFLLSNRARFQASSEGGAQPNISKIKITNTGTPPPALSEQRRIVARVDELMALLDRLEAARGAREATRDRFTTASLTRLTAPDPDTRAADTQSTLDALPALTARAEQIKQLRQTIVNLAVRGMLADTHGSERLDLECGDHMPAALPAHWVHPPLEQLLAEDTRNGYSRRPDDAEDGVPILRISAGTTRGDGVVAEEEHKLISGIDPSTRQQFGLRKGDLLACRFNGNKSFVGRFTIFEDYLGIEPIYPDKLIRIRLKRDRALPAFVRLAGESDLVRSSIEAACATTVGNWGISATRLREVPIPLPPLAEQHRIVAKVDELMALCDRLEAALTTADTTRARLLEALLHEALAPGSMARKAT